MKKRSIRIKGHATSILLEPEFWTALEDIAAAQKISLPALVAKIDEKRTGQKNLASALRVYALKMKH